MALLTVFPELPGLTYSVIKRPKWHTEVYRTASGYDLRVGYARSPLWEWDLIYDYLPDQGTASSSTASDLQTLLAFYQARRGALSGFLFRDPDEHQVSGQITGIGDGTTKTYLICRQFGHGIITLDADAPLEPVGYVDGAETFNVYLNGVLAAVSSYDLEQTYPTLQQIQFHAAPAAGAVITVDMTYLYYVRFKEDTYDFEKFYDKLWSQRLLTLTSLRDGSAGVIPKLPPAPVITAVGTSDTQAAVYVVSQSLRTANWQAGWTQLPGLPPNDTFGYATAVSANAKIIVGYAFPSGGGFSHACYWTFAGGVIDLGIPAGARETRATGVSTDGSVIVGTIYKTDGTFAAFRWTFAGGMVNIGNLGAQDGRNQAVSVNGDGNVIAASINPNPGDFWNRASRWTQANGWTTLGLLSTYTDTYAQAISLDGSTIVGNAFNLDTPYGAQACTWGADNAAHRLINIIGGSYSYCMGVSSNGDTIVGYLNFPVQTRAFVWTPVDGMIDPGFPTGSFDTVSLALGVSSDGTAYIGSLSGGSDFAFLHTVTAGVTSVANPTAASWSLVAVTVTAE